MSNKIIEVKDIYYKYSDGNYALEGVTLDIERGKKVAIIGANGAGKTTLFLHLNGIYKPTSGKIIIDDMDLKYDKKEMKNLRSKIGIVFQDSNTQLFSNSVVEEIAFGPMNMGLSTEEINSRINVILDKLGISNLREKPTHFLSGGEKKKVAIASILAMNPDIIVFDEPLANVDVKGTIEILDILNTLTNEGKTIILSTHDINTIYNWADYVYILSDGKIVGSGVPEDVFSNKRLMNENNIETPWILEVYEEIINNTKLKENHSVPKNKIELFNLLKKVI